MGKHYLNTRKPTRIARIRKKAAELQKQEVLLERIMEGPCIGGKSYAVSALCERLETLGYKKLCYLETLLDDLIGCCTTLKWQAIAEIAFLATSLGISMEAVLEMADRLHPNIDVCLNGRVIEHELSLILSETPHSPEEPFFFLRDPLRAHFGSRWANLQHLSLRELQVLYYQVRSERRIPFISAAGRASG